MKINLDRGVEKFIVTLEKSTIAKILRTMDLLEKFGYQLRSPHVKKIKCNLFELRIRGQQEVRLLYSFYRGEIFILHGFIKKSQKIPGYELEKALKKLGGLT